jgi:hypothetical protein
MRTYHLADDAELQTAIEAYFAEHPELNPDRVSVELAIDHDWVPDETSKYRAVGHVVIDPPAVPLHAVRASVSLDQAGQAAFHAYALLNDHTNHTMDAAEPWENQGQQVRQGFRAAADAVAMLCGVTLGDVLGDAPQGQ